MGIHSQFRGGWSGKERNVFFANASGERFVEMGYSLGLDFIDDGRSVAPLDFDGDGDLDLAVLNVRGLRLLENTAPTRRFVRVRLTAARMPADVLGAVVKIKTADGVQQDFVKATTGFATQVPLELHFGLKEATRVDALTVEWPSGRNETFRNLPVDRLWTIREGGGTDTLADSKIPKWPEASRPLGPREVLAEMTAKTVEGGREPLIELGRPTLVHVWDPEDPTTAKAFVSLAEQSKQARVAGVCKSSEGMKQAIAKFDLAGPQFVLTPMVQEALFGPETAARFPSTFLFDREGRLRRAMYRGVTKNDLKAALDHLDISESHEDYYTLGTTYLEREDLDTAGRMFQRSVELNPDSPHAQYYLGSVRYVQKRDEEAIEAFRRAIQIDDTYMLVHYNLAMVYVRTNRIEEAESELRKAVELSPGQIDAHLSLAKVLVMRDKKSEAEAELRRVLDIQADHAEALKMLDQLSNE